MKFAREGWKLVTPLALIGVTVLVVGFLQHSRPIEFGGGIILLCSLLILLFFRDPERTPPLGEDLVLAPADGKILLTEEMGDGRKRIAIFLSVFNVHVNRTPLAGVTKSVTLREGKYLNAANPASAEGNARVDVSANTAHGDIGWCQVSGLIARKISCRLSPGDSFSAGERFGLIYFGSRMEVYLPGTVQFMVAPGQNVRAGESVIAKFI